MLAKNLIQQALNPTLAENIQDFTVKDITCDSREASADCIFIAMPGTKTDGTKFARQAIEKGAKLVITHKKISNLDTTQIVIDDQNIIKTIPAKLANVFWGINELLQKRKITIHAVTGTNGKTTSCILIQHLLNRLGRRCARFGTIEYDLINEKIAATHTTPDAITLAKLIRKAYNNGADTIVMETSSHALTQGRCAGLGFASALFTNLTSEHLDYHGSMENYLQAKLLLFKSLDNNASAIVNIDDKAGEKILKLNHFYKISYAIENKNARLCAKIKKLSAKCNYFDLTFDNQHISVNSPYIGKHNIYNLLGAIGVVLSTGKTLKEISSALINLPVIPGRLERVETNKEFQIFVDYAHTDDGLKNVLSAIKPFVANKLIIVFGCGGDRDKSKRPRMAKIAEIFADIIIVTNDNPRTEDPKLIINDILTGFSNEKRKNIIIETDRNLAIKHAIESAEKGDIILIAGKGHEDYQIIGTEKIKFDDRECARYWLNNID